MVFVLWGLCALDLGVYAGTTVCINYSVSNSMHSSVYEAYWVPGCYSVGYSVHCMLCECFILCASSSVIHALYEVLHWVLTPVDTPMGTYSQWVFQWVFQWVLSG